MTPEEHAALRKPFDPKTIGKLPKGGTVLDFVGHAAVTDRLLAVDPDWTWEPFATDDNGLPAYQNGALWIRLTVCGVTRIGVGDGPDPKQRIGDAIRNAAMRFGVALDLWSRQELEGVDPNGGDSAAVAATTGSRAPAVDTPQAPAPAATPPADTPQAPGVQELRERVLTALKIEDKSRALKALIDVQLAASKQKALQIATTTPAGEQTTLGELIATAQKLVSGRDGLHRPQAVAS